MTDVIHVLAKYNRGQDEICENIEALGIAANYMNDCIEDAAATVRANGLIGGVIDFIQLMRDGQDWDEGPIRFEFWPMRHEGVFRWVQTSGPQFFADIPCVNCNPASYALRPPQRSCCVDYIPTEEDDGLPF